MIAAGRWVALPICACATGARAACFIAAFTLQFGAVSPSSPAPADSIGNVSVTCTAAPGTTLHYSLSLSAGSAGTFAPRRMRSGGGAALQYNLYVDAARSTVWGDGNGGTANVADASRIVATTVTRQYPVYGRIFAGQNVPTGAYADSILIALDF
jgi:spore coat protein U-like protein